MAVLLEFREVDDSRQHILVHTYFINWFYSKWNRKEKERKYVSVSHDFDCVCVYTTRDKSKSHNPFQNKRMLHIVMYACTVWKSIEVWITRTRYFQFHFNWIYYLIFESNCFSLAFPPLWFVDPFMSFIYSDWTVFKSSKLFYVGCRRDLCLTRTW